jgi:D-arabinose 1-dehydrogenase-like Zn-dependent alcohol dehydrogenase
MQNRVLCIEKGKADIVHLPMPHPKDGFVVVKQHLAPNCIEHRAYKTGFAEWHESPLHYGHEGVGEVWEIGPGVSGFKKGDRVIIFQGWTCGTCWVCEHGLGSTHCINIKGPKDIEAYNQSESGGNGFCEYRLVPANMIHHLPEDLDWKYAAAGNCLIGCTYTAVRDLHISREHYCLLGGVGFIGHATLVNLKYRNAKVIVLGRHERRMETAKELGADLIVNPENPEWLDEIRAFTPDNRGVDFSFECSGYPYYQQKCLDALRHYGTMVQLGYAADQKDLKWELNTEWGLCWGHKTITASFDVNFNHRKDLLEVLQDQWIQEKVDRLVTHVLPMSRAAEAFELLNKKEAGKVFFIPGE